MAHDTVPRFGTKITAPPLGLATSADDGCRVARVACCHVTGGTALPRPATNREYVDEEGGLGQHSDADPGPGGQRRGRHEGLDEPRDGQYDYEAQGHSDGRTSFLSQRGGASSRAWVDPCPEQPEAGGTGNEDRGQLQHPVRQDQSEKERATLVVDHDCADEPHVEHIL